MELFDKHIEILRAHHPRAAEILVTHGEAGNIEMLPARTGGFTASARLPDGRAHRLHSAMDPAGEPAKLFRNKTIQDRGLVVLCGLGLGYPLLCLNTLWAGRDDITVMAFEHEPAALALGLHHIDFSHVLADNRLILKIGEDAVAFSSGEYARVQSLSQRHITYLNLPGPFALRAELYRHIRHLMEGMLPPGNRVIVLGLSGADPDVVENLTASGKLPAMDMVIKNGVYARLGSTTPPHPGPAWATFATGNNPGKTGVQSCLRPAPGRYRQEPVLSGNVRTEKIWSAANRQDRTAGIWNLPLTSPPEPLRGLMLAGYPDHETCSYPPEIFNDMLRGIPDEVNGPADILEWDSFCVRTFIRDMNRGRMMRRADALYPVDLKIAVFELLECVQQRYMHLANPENPYYSSKHAPFLSGAVAAAYGIIDGIVQDTLNNMLPGDTLFIISEHGFQPCSGVFHFARLLAQKGWLTLKPDFENSTAAIKTNSELYEATDWSHTRAYITNEDIHSGAGIRINVCGRESRGIVAQGREYETLREGIIELLESVTHPETGEKLVASIHKREDIYTGDAVEDAPDIILMSRFQLTTDMSAPELFDDVHPQGPKQSCESRHFTGIPSGQGVFIAFGANILTGARIERADITDAAPTLLHALGVAVPEDMDGRPLSVFAERYMQRRPVRFDAATGARRSHGVQS